MTICDTQYTHRIKSGGTTGSANMAKRTIKIAMPGAGKIKIVAASGKTGFVRGAYLFDANSTELGRVEATEAGASKEISVPQAGDYYIGTVESMYIYEITATYTPGLVDDAYVAPTFALSNPNTLLVSELQTKIHKEKLDAGIFSINASENDPIVGSFSKKFVDSEAADSTYYNQLELNKNSASSISINVSQELLNSSTAATKGLSVNMLAVAGSTSSTVLVKDSAGATVETLTVTKDSNKMGVYSFTLTSAGEFKIVNTSTDDKACIFLVEVTPLLAE